MALIKCPACDKEISLEAKACIHCGHPMKQDEPTQNKSGSFGIASFFLGIIGLIAWIIPIIGALITITGLILGIKGNKGVHKRLSIVGIVLCAIGILGTTVNASIGVYKGAHGTLFQSNYIQSSSTMQSSNGTQAVKSAGTTTVVKTSQDATQVSSDSQVSKKSNEHLQDIKLLYHTLPNDNNTIAIEKNDVYIGVGQHLIVLSDDVNDADVTIDDINNSGHCDYDDNYDKGILIKGKDVGVDTYKIYIVHDATACVNFNVHVVNNMSNKQIDALNAKTSLNDYFINSKYSASASTIDRSSSTNSERKNLPLQQALIGHWVCEKTYTIKSINTDTNQIETQTMDNAMPFHLYFSKDSYTQVRYGKSIHDYTIGVVSGNNIGLTENDNTVDVIKMSPDRKSMELTISSNGAMVPTYKFHYVDTKEEP